MTNGTNACGLDIVLEWWLWRLVVFIWLIEKPLDAISYDKGNRGK